MAITAGRRSIVTQGRRPGTLITLLSSPLRARRRSGDPFRHGVRRQDQADVDRDGCRRGNDGVAVRKRVWVAAASTPSSRMSLSSGIEDSHADSVTGWRTRDDEKIVFDMVHAVVAGDNLASRRESTKIAVGCQGLLAACTSRVRSESEDSRGRIGYASRSPRMLPGGPVMPRS